jgi:SAM-dependent methyltransferase
MVSLERSFGREAFGLDPANYHAARPPYPEAVWRALRERAGVKPGIDILEIGAGTGLATAPLLAHQPSRLVAIEPDTRLVDFLRDTLPDARLEVLSSPFETADLPASAFDLAVCATAFHWLEPSPALQRIHGLLRPGGAVALFWNVFGDHDRADPFHDATVHLFAGHRTSLSDGGTIKIPFGFDAEARAADFRAAGFTPDPPQFLRWPLTLDPEGVRRLYNTYSNVTALPPDERVRLLDGLADVAATQFAGRVTRNMTTSIFTARRG